MPITISKKPSKARTTKKAAMPTAPKTSNPPESPSEYLTLKQVAAQIQTCTKTARKLIKENDVPVKRAGRQIRIHKSHVELLLKKEW